MERLRAHVRERMTRRGIGVTEAAKAIGLDQGYLSKWLRRQSEGGRGGISAYYAYRMTIAFNIDPDIFFNKNPPERFFKPYVPRPDSKDPLEAPATSAQATGRNDDGAAQAPAKRARW